MAERTPGSLRSRQTHSRKFFVRPKYTEFIVILPLIGVTADPLYLLVQVVMLGCVAVGGYVCYTAFCRLTTVYHILRNDPMPVRALHDHRGPVVIEGQAVEGDDGTIESPFTGRSCLAYSYEVEEYVPGAKGTGKSRHTLDTGICGVDFVVDDGTGRVVVDPTGADIHFESHQQTVSTGTEPPGRVRDFLDANDIGEDLYPAVDLKVTTWQASKPGHLNFDKKQRFTERRLNVGDTAYVYGQAMSGPEVRWGSNLVDALVGDGDDTPVFVVSDTDERQTARRIVRTAVRKAALGLLFVLWFGMAFVLML